MRPSSLRRQPQVQSSHGMEPARIGYHKIVADILRRAPVEDAMRIAWQLVAGARVAQRTTVLDLTRGVLRVRVPDATWRAQMAEFAPQYLAGLNSMLGETVERIELVLEEKKPAHRA